MLLFVFLIKQCESGLVLALKDIEDDFAVFILQLGERSVDGPIRGK